MRKRAILFGAAALATTAVAVPRPTPDLGRRSWSPR